MTLERSAVALIALDAAVIDTETTGLDPRRARIVELAAVRLACGQPAADAAFTQRVNPGEPIPAAAARIHGIDDGAVAGAPDFAASWPNFARAVGDLVLIGHSIGFDIAVLRRECERAAILWDVPAALDTHLLAQIANPRLADYSLDHVAAWLGVPVLSRHSALGDAVTTARVFAGLAPRLGDMGIRTVAEALRACRQLTDAMERQSSAGWSEPVVPGPGLPGRIDSQPYRLRVGSLMRTPPLFIDVGATIGTALKVMIRERISSLFVRPAVDAAARPAQCGIITERDILRLLDGHGVDALTLPVDRATSRPLAAVPAGAFAYLAIARMNRLRVRHLGVTDENGLLTGALSARDLLRLRAEGAAELGDELEQARNIPELGRAWAKLARVAADLRHDGMSGREIAALVSHGLCELTRQAALLAEARILQDGRGAPPCAYALAVLGSGGRGESLLAMDQDHALIFADDAPPSAEEWFAELSGHVADILNAVGVPYCKGGVMAKNPQWRGSLSNWRGRVADWVRRSSPGDLLAIDIFFDLLPVHGEVAMAEALWREGFDLARGQTAFAKLLIEAGSDVQPVRNWFGRLRTEQGRIDLKKSGLFALVTTARALAICHHVVERATPARLDGLRNLKLGLESDIEALTEAQAWFLDLILDQQIDDIARGRRPDNSVEIKRLTARDRDRLRAALAVVENIDEIGRTLLFRA